MTISPTPAQFRASHGDMRSWQAVDFEVYQHLVEVHRTPAPKPRRPGPARTPQTERRPGP